MDNLSEKLAGILNDPESLERIKKMAEGLLGEKEPVPEPEPPPSAGGGFPDVSELAGMMKVLSGLKNTGEDDRTRLLLALRPHLSEPRQQKVDTAVKILRVIDLLPALRESGLLGKLL